MVDEENKDFAGKNGFTWWIGVVEDRQDPLKLGRCRVRCVGWHAEDKVLLPTEFLPWAMPSMPLNNSNAYTPREGDMVFGFFVDGENAQEPVMMGIIPGIPLKAPNRQEAFTDNRSNEKLSTSPRFPANKVYHANGYGIILTETQSAGLYPNRLDEPSTPRVARNDPETIQRTFIQERKDTRVVGVPSFNNIIYNTWNEPQTAYNSQYPYNNAVETESGHIMEFDDTFGSERIHIAHRNGSFIEWLPEGSRVEKVTKNNYSIILKDDHLYVMGNVHVTVQGNTEIYVRENAYVRVDKNLRANVGGNVFLGVNGYVSANIIGNFDAQINGNAQANVVGHVALHSGGSMSIGVDGNFTHFVKGTYTVESLGNMVFKAPRVDINP